MLADAVAGFIGTAASGSDPATGLRDFFGQAVEDAVTDFFGSGGAGAAFTSAANISDTIGKAISDWSDEGFGRWSRT